MRHLRTIVVVAGLLSAGTASEARQTTPQRQATPSPPQAPPVLPSTGPQQSSPGMFVERPDARETRERLNELLNQYPPSVREVLRIDPTLMYRADYMANYPVLAAFLRAAPGSGPQPGVLRRRVAVPGAKQQSADGSGCARCATRSSSQASRLIVMTIATGIIFLVRTVVEHWRWQRAMKAQSDLNNKLIDRFASNQELLAYLQSPQGQAADRGAGASAAGRCGIMDAPLNRIFWSLQAGAVLACGGFGLLIGEQPTPGRSAAGRRSVLFAFGLVVLTVGAGFLLSSAISYFLSQRLGLVRAARFRPSYSGEAPGS